MVLSLLSFATSYFTPSLYFYVIYATVAQISSTSDATSYLARILSLIFVLVYMVAIAGGLSGSVWTKHAEAVSIVFSFITFSMLGLVTYNIVAVYLDLTANGINFKSFNQVSILVMCAINIGGYFLIIILHVFTHPKLVWRLLIDTFSYWFYQGAYSQTMVAHAFCNVDDVSWGTKGSTSQHGGKHYESDKVFFVSAWYFVFYLGFSGMQLWLMCAFM